MKFQLQRLVLILIILILPHTASAEIFRFQYTEGEKHRILTTVSEDVLINGRLNNHTEIINRITEEVLETAGNGTADETSATVYATFMTSEEATMPQNNAETKNFTWGEEFSSTFTRNQLGLCNVPEQYTMPTVRNIPVFPEKDVQNGERWYADGYEVHDLSRNFPTAEPLIVPFTATYEYLGIADAKETQSLFPETPDTSLPLLHKISAEYSLYTEYPVPRGADGSYPVAIMGFSNRTIYFDNEIGKVITWKENFRIVLETKRGDRIEYHGTSKTEIDKSTLPDRKAMIAAVQEQIENLGIENTSVVESEQGITISIENIQFLPDSAWLTPGEQAKLQLIAGILAPFTDNDLLITGHTARVGSEESCQELSLKRARAVADYLKKQGIQDEYHVFTRGKGSAEPIADNSTEAGRERNRRVEITIIQ